MASNRDRPTQRERRRANGAAAAKPGASPRPAPPARIVVRLPPRLLPRQQVAIGVIALCGVAAFAGLPDRFKTYDRHPIYAVIVTVVLLASLFTIERRALRLTARASLRFAGVGILSPVMWYIVPIGALTPICALQGMTSWRLGVASVFPPTIVATVATTALFGPISGMMVAVGHVWPGTAALLLTRRAEGG